MELFGTKPKLADWIHYLFFITCVVYLVSSIANGTLNFDFGTGTVAGQVAWPGFDGPAGGMQSSSAGEHVGECAQTVRGSPAERQRREEPTGEGKPRVQV